MASRSTGKEVWVIGQAEEKRCLLHDLEDGAFDGGSIGVGDRIQVERDDRDSIGELL